MACVAAPSPATDEEVDVDSAMIHWLQPAVTPCSILMQAVCTYRV
ncbi:hypothetical protein MPER_08684 [Moniliophthora perniciosa FA553]|nr:hypothetical protein MPER_08684 [Moniliophthora perniciosa FA553]